MSITGLLNGSTGGNIVGITKGSCDDSTGTVTLTLSSATTIDITTTGAGGLDTGSPAADTSYAIYVARLNGTDGVVASTSFDPEGTNPPSWPTGTKYRRIGAFCTDSAKKVVSFVQLGGSDTRTVLFTPAQSKLQVLDGGSATAATDVELSPWYPETGLVAKLLVIPDGASVTLNGDGTGGGPTVTVPDAVILELMPGQDSSMGEYMNSGAGGSTDIYILGFTDLL